MISNRKLYLFIKTEEMEQFVKVNFFFGKHKFQHHFYLYKNANYSNDAVCYHMILNRRNLEIGEHSSFQSLKQYLRLA